MNNYPFNYPPPSSSQQPLFPAYGRPIFNRPPPPPPPLQPRGFPPFLGHRPNANEEFIRQNRQNSIGEKFGQNQVFQSPQNFPSCPKVTLNENLNSPLHTQPKNVNRYQNRGPANDQTSHSFAFSPTFSNESHLKLPQSTKFLDRNSSEFVNTIIDCDANRARNEISLYGDDDIQLDGFISNESFGNTKNAAADLIKSDKISRLKSEVDSSVTVLKTEEKRSPSPVVNRNLPIFDHDALEKVPEEQLKSLSWFSESHISSLNSENLETTTHKKISAEDTSLETHFLPGNVSASETSQNKEKNYTLTNDSHLIKTKTKDVNFHGKGHSTTQNASFFTPSRQSHRYQEPVFMTNKNSEFGKDTNEGFSTTLDDNDEVLSSSKNIFQMPVSEILNSLPSLQDLESMLKCKPDMLSDDLVKLESERGINSTKPKLFLSESTLPFLDSFNSGVPHKELDITMEASNTSIISNESGASEWSRNSSIPFLGEAAESSNSKESGKFSNFSLADCNKKDDCKKRSTLEDALEQLAITDPVIGLDYITENQKSVSVAGSFPFRCNLCKSQMTRSLIIDHVLGSKHRLLYLKTKDKVFYDVLAHDITSSKESNICEAAAQLEKKYGRGHVIVDFTSTLTSHKSIIAESNIADSPLITPFFTSDSNNDVLTNCENQKPESPETEWQESLQMECIKVDDHIAPDIVEEVEKTVTSFDGEKGKEAFVDDTVRNTLKRSSSPFEHTAPKALKLEYSDKEEIKIITESPCRGGETLENTSNGDSYSRNDLNSSILERLSTCEISSDDDAEIVLKTLDTLTKLLLRYKLRNEDIGTSEHLMRSIQDGTGTIEDLLVVLNKDKEKQLTELDSLDVLQTQEVRDDFPNKPASHSCVNNISTVSSSELNLIMQNSIANSDMEVFGSKTDQISLPVASSTESEPSPHATESIVTAAQTTDAASTVSLQPPPFFQFSSSKNTPTISQLPVTTTTTGLMTPWSNVYQSPHMYTMPYYQSQFMSYSAPGVMYHSGQTAPPPPAFSPPLPPQAAFQNIPPLPPPLPSLDAFGSTGVPPPLPPAIQLPPMPPP